MIASEEYITRVRELNTAITIRDAELKDGNDFVSLFNSYYKRKTSRAYFEWQFFTSPYASKLFTAYDGDRLVAYYGIKIYSLSNNVNAGFVIDVLTDDMYRKRGISLLLESEALAFCSKFNVVLLAALPNAHGNAALKALKWKSISKIDTLIFENMPLVSSVFEVFNTPPAQQLIAFNKGNDFRNWRFNLNPQYEYETFQLDSNSLGVIKLFTDPVTGSVYGDIVDFAFDGNQNEAVLLFKKIQSRMIEKAVKTLTTWALPHSVNYNFFTRIGFTPLPQERYFCVKILDSQFSELSAIEHWDLVQTDAEIF